LKPLVSGLAVTGQVMVQALVTVRAQVMGQVLVMGLVGPLALQARKSWSML